MRILVTGAAGFIGRHTCAALIESGYHVSALDRRGSAPVRNTEWFECDPSGGYPDGLAGGKRSFDAVIHLAGRTGGSAAELDEANRRSVAILLDSLGCHTGRLVLASSSAVYGVVPDDRQPVREDYQPLLPVTNYGESMLSREIEAGDSCGRHEIPLCILRLFNITGPGQGPGMLVPDTIRKLAGLSSDTGSPVISTGPLDAERDIVDVRDAARAFLLASEGGASGIFNIASGTALPVRLLIGSLVALIRPGTTVREDRAGSGSPVGRLSGDCTRARTVLGWSARIPIDISLRDAVTGREAGTGS